MDEGEMAELIGRTLEYAIRRCEGIPAIRDVVALDIGEIEVTETFNGQRFRLSVSKIETSDAR